jgi:hypothetical protein
MAHNTVTVIIDGMTIEVSAATAAILKRFAQAQQEEQAAWIKQQQIMAQKP